MEKDEKGKAKEEYEKSLKKFESLVKKQDQLLRGELKYFIFIILMTNYFNLHENDNCSIQ